MTWFIDLNSSGGLLTTIAFGLLTYLVVGAIYRLYFSPTAKFPGPPLAALTLWYEFYYDVIKPGQFMWEIRKIHQRYGPVVRINPYEVHVDDVNFIDEFYGGPTKKRDKWELWARMFGNSTSMSGTLDHDHHRLRRAPLNPLFSKRSVSSLEPLIRSAIETLCARIEEFRHTGKPINLTNAFCALTTDIITEYSFGVSYQYLSKPDFAPHMMECLAGLVAATPVSKQFGWVPIVMQAMPLSLVEIMMPDMAGLIQIRRGVEKQIRAILNGNNIHNKASLHPSIFHEFLNSELPPHEKSFIRLMDEGQSLVAAGSATTAHYLAAVICHILTNPHVEATLRDELTKAIPDAAKLPSCTELEQLPYLSAVYLEGLRVTYGMTGRSTRISPKTPLHVKGWTIPAGVPISMTAVFVHDDPTLFPEPKKFKPERWLIEPSARARLERCILNFGKGTRTCLGMNLARAEIFLTLAKILRTFENLELFETDRSDVDMARAYFVPLPRADAKGVRVLVD